MCNVCEAWRLIKLGKVIVKPLIKKRFYVEFTPCRYRIKGQKRWYRTDDFASEIYRKNRLQILV